MSPLIPSTSSPTWSATHPEIDPHGHLATVALGPYVLHIDRALRPEHARLAVVAPTVAGRAVAISLLDRRDADVLARALRLACGVL